MPRASKTRVFSMTSEVSRGCNLIHLQTTQSWKVANMVVSGGVSCLLSFTPKCHDDRLQWVGLLIPGSGKLSWGSSVHHIFFPSPCTDFLGLLMDSPDVSQPQQWDLGFFAHSVQLSAGISSRAVRSHYRAQNLPSLCQAVFLGISLPQKFRPPLQLTVFH